MADESNRNLSSTPTNDKLSVVNDEDDDGVFNSSSAGGDGGITKAKVTRKRYSREMIVTLLEIVDEILPCGNKDWDTVALKYNVIYSVSSANLTNIVSVIYYSFLSFLSFLLLKFFLIICPFVDFPQ